jgi:hypothetical protein
VKRADDIASLAAFHFSSLGYELIEQQPHVSVFQRGRKWGGIWDTNIRGLFTRLTVRMAPAGGDEVWVSCDWSVRSLGAIISKRDITTLEAEGRGLESLLRGEKDVSNPIAPVLQHSNKAATGAGGSESANEFRPHQIACAIGLSIVAVLGMALGSIGTWLTIFVRIKAQVDGPPAFFVPTLGNMLAFPCMFAAGLLVAVAADRLWKLRSYDLCIAGSIVAVVLAVLMVGAKQHVGFFLAILPGIYTFWLLQKQSVREAFATQSDVAQVPAKSPPEWWLSRPAEVRKPLKGLLWLVFLFLAIVFLSFGTREAGSELPGPAENYVRITEVGAFDPWFRSESTQGPKGDASFIRQTSSRVEFLSWSMLAGILAAILLSALVGIEKLERAIRLAEERSGTISPQAAT